MRPTTLKLGLPLTNVITFLHLVPVIHLPFFRLLPYMYIALNNILLTVWFNSIKLLSCCQVILCNLLFLSYQKEEFVNFIHDDLCTRPVLIFTVVFQPIVGPYHNGFLHFPFNERLWCFSSLLGKKSAINILETISGYHVVYT